jgi:NADPH:quinone reductase-like Zn-dependent oxidoreductase
VAGINPGEKVLAFGVQGSYAEYFIAKGERTFPVPATMSMEQAATIGQIFITSWNAVAVRAKLQRGESILVQSAGNGAGIAAVQIAKHLGARVIGTASNAEKLKAAKEAGADEAINYVEQDFVAEVMRLTNNRGVDVVLDGVGGETFTKGMKCLAPNGRILSLGFSGRDSTIQFHTFDLARGIVVMGGAAGTAPLPRDIFEHILTLFKEGQFRPVPVTVFPWTEAAKAHQAMEQRKVAGKIAIKVG